MRTGKLYSSQLQKAIRAKEPCRLSDGGNLYFNITKGGTASWIFRFTSPVYGKQREASLGLYDEVSLTEARDIAQEWRAQTARDLDPLDERKKQRQQRVNTVDKLWEAYYKKRKGQIKTHESEQSRYLSDIQPVIGKLLVTDVNPEHIQTILHQIALSKKPRLSVANKVLALLKRLLKHAVKLGFTQYNVAALFDNSDAGGKEQPRQRALRGQEFTVLFDSIRAAGTSFSRENQLAVALLLTLGTRKMELLSSKWEDIDLNAGTWHLRAENNKMNINLVIPLEPEVVAIFRELKILAAGKEYVFPARRTDKKAVHPHMGKDTLNRAFGGMKFVRPMEHFTVHDFRRSCRTALADLRVPPHIAERYINHKTDTYDTSDYLEERREAQRKLIDYLWPLTGLDKDPIISEWTSIEYQQARLRGTMQNTADTANVGKV
ncbi:tyrosine-type recombinase/integrase [Oceanimonas baumannii]|uniref:tyrosine-type recombinase/integrase n=1 Tax=Oceanimonas baumannii TaxID=129578 RepID=UPI003A8FA248